MTQEAKQRAIYIPHGGGPCFFMPPPADDPRRWVGMEQYLRAMPASLPARPDALVVISAHWEMPQPTVLAAANPGLLFDYFGFPPHTYQLTYPAPGSPELAARVRGLLAAAGIENGEESVRGYDHGVFVPMKVSFPDADIPIVQLSMQHGLDAARHYAIGQALTPLRYDNVLIIGSGMSYHNMQGFREHRPERAAVDFDAWLVETLCAVKPSERAARLCRWRSAPGAFECQPEPDHLLPLMVAAGAADGEVGVHAFNGSLMGKPVSAFHFGL
jgi:aromatic ring-opening dioxygenase catalytic subunit (LigB family)